MRRRAVWRPVLPLGAEESHPDMGDDAGAFDIHQRVGGAGSDPEVVGIASLQKIAFGERLGVIFAIGALAESRSFPLADSRLRLCEIGKRARLSRGKAANKDKKERDSLHATLFGKSKGESFRFLKWALTSDDVVS